jgi:hypothetical protein
MKKYFALDLADIVTIIFNSDFIFIVGQLNNFKKYGMVKPKIITVFQIAF